LHPSFPFHLSKGAGILLVMSLLLTACGVFAETSPSTPTSPAPVPTLPIPTDTPTLTATTTFPPPTTSPTPSPTALPSFPDPAAYEWAVVVPGLDLPVDIQNAGDGSGRLFIVEKRGRILILKDDQLLPNSFLDIRDEVNSTGTEQGLLGLAFHPHYSQNGAFYISYINLNGDSVVAGFHVSADDSNRADPTSEVDLLQVSQPYANHNGGSLAFGPDGNLYIGFGDGGSRGDPHRNSQNLQTMLGKILRINVDSGNPYSVPPDNPFIGGGGLPEIWAYGLRNPWRFSFDRLTGNLYIGDVGQDAWEEVDIVPEGMGGGMNFGWSYYEGTHPYQDQPPANTPFTWPVAEYSHAEGCSITGGYSYRGSALPEWQGVYFYGDYCSGRIWGLIQTGQDIWKSKALFSTGVSISTLGVDETGKIYLADYRSGRLLRLIHR
jgi:glucose/arabinose dehydrogenase